MTNILIVVKKEENESMVIMLVLFRMPTILRTEVVVQICVECLGCGRRHEIFPRLRLVRIARFLEYLVSRFCRAKFRQAQLYSYSKGFPLQNEQSQSEKFFEFSELFAHFLVIKN